MGNYTLDNIRDCNNKLEGGDKKPEIKDKLLYRWVIRDEKLDIKDNILYTGDKRPETKY